MVDLFNSHILIRKRNWSTSMLHFLQLKMILMKYLLSFLFFLHLEAFWSFFELQVLSNLNIVYYNIIFFTFFPVGAVLIFQKFKWCKGIFECIKSKNLFSNWHVLAIWDVKLKKKKLTRKQAQVQSISWFL